MSACWDNLITTYCYKCKKTFKHEVKFCPDCKYKKGKDKGEAVRLKERSSKVHFCQLNRGEYGKIS